MGIYVVLKSSTVKLYTGYYRATSYQMYSKVSAHEICIHPHKVSPKAGQYSEFTLVARIILNRNVPLVASMETTKPPPSSLHKLRIC